MHIQEQYFWMKKKAFNSISHLIFLHKRLIIITEFAVKHINFEIILSNRNQYVVKTCAAIQRQLVLVFLRAVI